MSASHDVHHDPATDPLIGAYDDQLDLIDRFAARIPFARGDEIYAQDEETDLIYRVVRGAVREMRVLNDGRVRYGACYVEGDVFGFDAAPVHRFAAEALSTCLIAVVRRSTIEALGGDLDGLIWAAATLAA
ncbi:cyclic nucleotide-binding domain-containing protein [Phenylobacterium montanum]|uniref:Cyclic nucleotide-binding domain-containing protein n=1 Tax=Phenylobacterium montanum TaxID=2823693 RepID=A0A975IVX0_9CAUL|nr:cyclic nucleotide-binding domain-containing protein [Caulobacter sp. S6]QUD89447.1 cyclic nucleotide-binding domain-containing protein [Caulobacter sp. S6]